MKQIISFLLIVVLGVSFITPVFATSSRAASNQQVAKGVVYSQEFKSAMDARLTSILANDGSLNKAFLWRTMDKVVATIGYGGFDSYADISKALSTVNQCFDSARVHGLWQDMSKSDIRLLEIALNGPFRDLNWIIELNPTYGYLIIEKNSGLVLCNSSGAFPYFKIIQSTPEEPDQATEDKLGGKWLPLSGVSKLNNIVSMAVFDDIVAQLQAQGEKVDMAYYSNKTLGGIQHRTKQVLGEPLVYCDSKGRPYRVQLSANDFAVNQDNNYYTGSNSSSSSGNTTIYDQGNTENNTLVDVDNNTIWFPDGTLNYIENLLYDESTKTYYVDAHQEYDIENNTYITNNYSYTYHINYTSITYIGATEEYNKTYELYYQLPDGRSSADLTAEELKALNVSVDVVPYIRSTDNTALRSLYHFDGNVNDSSYWNYTTSFDWKKGASITYLESGAFEGCLYLDETEHEFEITAPSGIGSQDFTLQWRMYGSATIAPVSDSWVSIGNEQMFTFSGSYITFNGTQYAVPVGNWYEVALIRQAGTLRLYLNGIQVGSRTNNFILSKTVLFHFGNQRQTYVQLDELRLLNYALVKNGAAYTPTAVPYDTNLALVLPDSTTPVADEYWSIKSDGNLLPVYNFMEPLEKEFWTLDWSTTSGIDSVKNNHVTKALNKWNYYSKRVSISHSGSFLTLENIHSSFTYLWIPLFSVRRRTGSITQKLDGCTFELGKTYSASILLADGSCYSFSFSVDSYSSSSETLGICYFGDGRYIRARSIADDADNYFDFQICLPVGKSVDLVYLELKEGEPNTGHEFVTSVAPVNSNFKTPTLAVRTDLEITGHQIGGVRPSLPERGLVWGLVEDGRITSLQIYNGQAWESVDGRIWTGSRWVPYYAYDVLLLKDMYDIIESDPSQEYIYTEQGFWSWFQRAWNQQLMSKLDAILFAMGGGSGPGSDTSNGSLLDKVGEAFSDGLAALVKGVFNLISTILEKILGLAAELLSFCFNFLSDALVSAIRGFFSLFADTDGSLFGFFRQEQEGEDGEPVTVTGLPSGVAAVFAFFSGAVMCLPVELRSLLIFGVAAMFLFSVFKMVSHH